MRDLMSAAILIHTKIGKLAETGYFNFPYKRSRAEVADHFVSQCVERFDTATDQV